MKKLAKQAPKFILTAYHPELENYVFAADKTKTNLESILTVNKTNALMFSIGFDNEEIKEKAYSAMCKISGLDLSFIAIPA